MKKGKFYENLACSYLLSQNFKIITRNYRSPWGEIDILAEKDGKLFVVEVKGGKNLSTLPERINCLKVKRIFKTLMDYLSKNSEFLNREILFLAVFVDRKRKIEKLIFSPDECL